MRRWIVGLVSLGMVGTAHAEPPERPGFGVLRPEPGQDETAQAKSRLEASLRTALYARDAVRQLGPGGELLSALRDAVYAGSMELECETVLAAAVDASGQLVSFGIVATDATPEPLEQTVEAARERLRSHPVRLPSSAHGATFRVRISSRVRLPSGNPAPRTTVQKVISVARAAVTFEWGDIGSLPKRTVAVRLEDSVIH